MPLKLYTDTHIAKAIVAQLRNRGVDVIRAQDIGMDHANDAAHLEFASGEGRAVLSFDDDFEVLHYQWMQAGKHHFGIFLVTRDHQNIGMIVEYLAFWNEASNGEAASIEADVYSQFHHIPGR